jgi:sugar fermentation stimulation protein A
MDFIQPLIPGKLIQRYKRFLADIRLEDGSIVTAHCPNSGSMKTCKTPGWSVLLSTSDNKKRRYKFTWEMVHNGTCWIGINTFVPNRIGAEAIQEGRITELAGYDRLYREQKYGQNSRIDLLLKNATQKCYVEIKNVTLVEDDGNYYFPDAVTERGKKHLLELRKMVTAGNRAVMLFIIQRADGKFFRPAAHIDPEYSKTLLECHESGVEILAYKADVNPRYIRIEEKVPWEFV